MTVDPATQTQALLDEAASLLDALGTAPAATVPAEAVLYCLFAAQSLAVVGAHSSRTGLVGADPAATVRAAMTALSQVDAATFDLDAVRDAARAARRALVLLE